MTEKGITCLHGCEETWSVWKDIYSDENIAQFLPRVELSLYYNYWCSIVGDKTGPCRPYEKLSISRVKIFTDGALGPKTAALSSEYLTLSCKHGKSKSGHSGHCGIAIETKQSLIEKIAHCYSKNFSVEIHVIGDLAAEYAVDAIIHHDEERKSKNLVSPILIHCQLLQPATIEKMKKYNIYASVQPQFVPTDCRWLDKLLTEEYMDSTKLYAWKTLMENDILIGGGSDSPVEQSNSLLGIFDSIFRLKSAERDDLDANNIFIKEEQLSFKKALQIYTKDAMKLVNFNCPEHESILKIGQPADFIVLDTERDISVECEKLKNVQVLQTFVNGIECLRGEKGQKTIDDFLMK